MSNCIPEDFGCSEGCDFAHSAFACEIKLCLWSNSFFVFIARSLAFIESWWQKPQTTPKPRADHRRTYFAAQLVSFLYKNSFNGINSSIQVDDEVTQAVGTYVDAHGSRHCGYRARSCGNGSGAKECPMASVEHCMNVCSHTHTHTRAYIHTKVCGLSFYQSSRGAGCTQS